MEDKNEKPIKVTDLSEENLYLTKNNILKDELNTKNKGQETLFISDKETKDINKAEIKNKEVSNVESKEELKTSEDINKAEIKNKEVSNVESKKELKISEDINKTKIKNKEVSKVESKEELKTSEDINKTKIENKEVSKVESKDELKTSEVTNKTEIENKEVSKAEIKEELTPIVKKRELDNKNSENKVINTNSDTNQPPLEKSNQIIKDRLDIKPKVKPKKEIPIEKKPFNEFINDHLIPEIINEFNIRGKIIDTINIKKTNRPISEDICWVIYCEVQETCNFWLSFEKEDISSLKSFSLCKNYEKPSIIESFLIDEKKITLKLIISRILQRLNGQKLIGAN